MAFTELSLVKNLIFWIDIVDNSKNLNNAIFVKPFNNSKALPQNLTGNQFNLKNNFHGYGGKSYKCLILKEKFYLIWIDKYSHAIWLQIFEAVDFNETTPGKYLLSVQEPRQLSKSIEVNFDSSFVITENNFLYGIFERKNRDYLFSLNLLKTNQDLNELRKFDNFAGDLCSNKSANLLAWTEWDNPNMPWEKNDLFFSEIGFDGDIKVIKKFSNKLINDNKKVSFFQPNWISDSILVCSEDSSGWWNLLFIDVGKIKDIFIKKRVEKKFFEYGSPQWISGITFFAGSIKNLFCLAKKYNTWIIEQYQDLKYIQKFDLPFSSVNDFSAFDQKVVLTGSGYDFLNCSLELDFKDYISPDYTQKLSIEYIKDFSKPESFWFNGFDNQSTHAFIYKPLIKRFRKPPLILKAHSGPTSYFDGSYNSEVQYWTAKGFFVAEVNYGGSSGFGRDYRERINSRWGIIDTYDCNSLAIELIRLNFIDSDKIIIFGNSAGGLTALNSLCSGNIFKAAICKYPVIDLKDMYYNTHRFEKDYLNSLIGNYQTCSNEYKNRSPINKIKNIKKPILIFHGKKDSVISYKKTLEIKENLILNNQHSEVIFFENEGHGFRNIETKKEVLQKTEEFLYKVLKI